MKKVRFLGLVLTAAMTLIGAGYAYWNDSVTINSIVNTGKLEAKFDTTKTAVTFNNNINANRNIATGGIVYHDPAHNGDSAAAARYATVTLSNLYPGATVEVELNIVNDSTIPVKFADIVFANQSVFDSTKATISVDFDYAGDENIDYTVHNILSSTAEEELEQLNIKEIPAGKDVAIKLHVSISTDLEDDENETLNFSIAPTFQQFNK
jgi:predicted ribosomally synthesized peptide with SipW-like signal peptide